MASPANIWLVGIGGHACHGVAGNNVTVFKPWMRELNEGLLAAASQYAALTNSTFATAIDKLQ